MDTHVAFSAYSCRLPKAGPPACICHPVGLHMPSRGATFGIPHDQFIIHTSSFWLRNNESGGYYVLYIPPHLDRRENDAVVGCFLPWNA